MKQQHNICQGCLYHFHGGRSAAEFKTHIECRRWMHSKLPNRWELSRENEVPIQCLRYLEHVVLTQSETDTA